MGEYLQQIAQSMGWDYEVEYGTSGNFICQCGDLIEQDGQCSDCGPSPAMRLGLI